MPINPMIRIRTSARRQSTRRAPDAASHKDDAFSVREEFGRLFFHRVGVDAAFVQEAFAADPDAVPADFSADAASDDGLDFSVRGDVTAVALEYVVVDAAFASAPECLVGGEFVEGDGAVAELEVHLHDGRTCGE